MFLLNGQRLPEGAPFVHDGVQYPANWLNIASAEAKAAIGIIEVQEQPRPDDTLYWVSDNGDGTFSAEPKDIDTLRAMWRDKLKARRDIAQFGGMSLNGLTLQTDIDSQTKYVGAAVAAMLDGAYTVQWKTGDGTFVELSAGQIIGISQAVREHVQHCYDNEAVLAAEIESAGDLNSLQSIDIEAGWPTYA